MTLYDYIYVDLEKVTSLYSQLIGGVVEVREINKERAHSADNKRHYDFKVFKHDAGGTEQDNTGLKEIIKPHHSVLVELEEKLAENGYLIDLTREPVLPSLQDPEFRRQLGNTLCLKVSGRATIEDYERMKLIAQAFPEIVKLINKSAESGLRSAPAYLELKSQMDEMEQDVKQTKDRNMRKRKEQQLKSAQRLLETHLLSAIKVDGVDQWVLDGMKTWINTFLPGIRGYRFKLFPLHLRLLAH